MQQEWKYRGLGAVPLQGSSVQVYVDRSHAKKSALRSTPS